MTKIINIMFFGCIASPALLGILSGKDVFFPKVFNGNMGAAGAILYIPVLFIVSGFSEIKISDRTMLFYTYGLITFCMGAFLVFTLSWWYIFISIWRKLIRQTGKLLMLLLSL